MPETFLGTMNWTVEATTQISLIVDSENDINTYLNGQKELVPNNISVNEQRNFDDNDSNVFLDIDVDDITAFKTFSILFDAQWWSKT